MHGIEGGRKALARAISPANDHNPKQLEKGDGRPDAKQREMFSADLSSGVRRREDIWCRENREHVALIDSYNAWRPPIPISSSLADGAIHPLSGPTLSSSVRTSDRALVRPSTRKVSPPLLSLLYLRATGMVPYHPHPLPLWSWSHG